MRNDITQTKLMLDLVSQLPYFEVADLLPALKYSQNYLRIILSRAAKKGELVRLKKGIYVSAHYLYELEKKNLLSSYTEFLASALYKTSYLSLEYVLYEKNILSEMPRHFTLISRLKTARFSNKLGTFFYHKIKNDLFAGYEIETKDNFSILKATKAKALFDFIYLRKDLITDKVAAEELRLNLESFNKKDWHELRRYIEKEGSKKMQEILNYLK